MSIEERLNAAGINMPKPPLPVGNYKATLISGNTLLISGQMPIENGKMKHTGKLGFDVDIETGQAAAELAAINALSQIHHSLKNADFTFKRILHLEGYINATDDFTQHADVLNGASDLFANVLDDQAGHVRTVFGCTSLPANAAVELIVTAEVEKLSK